jgi:hypothetical protein
MFYKCSRSFENLFVKVTGKFTTTVRGTGRVLLVTCLHLDAGAAMGGAGTRNKQLDILAASTWMGKSNPNLNAAIALYIDRF